MMSSHKPADPFSAVLAPPLNCLGQTRREDYVPCAPSRRERHLRFRGRGHAPGQGTTSLEDPARPAVLVGQQALHLPLQVERRDRDGRAPPEGQEGKVSGAKGEVREEAPAAVLRAREQAQLGRPIGFEAHAQRREDLRRRRDDAGSAVPGRQPDAFPHRQRFEHRLRQDEALQVPKVRPDKAKPLLPPHVVARAEHRRDGVPLGERPRCRRAGPARPGAPGD